jgi:hypothetical protein
MSGLPQYEVSAPSSEYNNKTLGVKFDAGHAYLSDRTVNEKYMGRGVHETAEQFLIQFPEYHVEALTPEARALLADWQSKTSNAPASKTSVVLKTPRLKKNNIVAMEGIYKTEV